MAFDLKKTYEFTPDDFKHIDGLMIATPCYGGNCLAEMAARVVDLTNLCHQLGIKITWRQIIQESLVQRARTYLTHYFEMSAEKKEYSHMLFWDADVVPRQVADVLAMLKVCNDEKKVVFANYPKKHILFNKVAEGAKLNLFQENPNELAKLGGDFVFNPLNSGPINLREPVATREGGTGFMMIHHTALEKFRASFPQYRYKPDHVFSEHFNGQKEIYAYFHVDFDRVEITGGSTNRLLSEDYFFCSMLRKAGEKIWLLPWIELGHIGTYKFEGSMMNMAYLEHVKQQHMEAEQKKVQILEEPKE